MKAIKQYFGLPDVEYMYLNEWSDPRLIFNGYSYNIYDVEDTLLADYDD
ncbi:MAG: hypothetical protein NC489_27510 [Ruminococcus flavefaciens]|nr:hypothetical protein [Ruminococcus flavefaciens]